jgi:polysaccharide export outer membrane protein
MVLALAGSWVWADEPSSSAETTRVEYVIGFGDLLKVSVQGEELTLRVRPDGKISVPGIDDVQVEGKTPATVSQEITSGLAGILEDPEVTVVVEEIGGYPEYFIGLRDVLRITVWDEDLLDLTLRVRPDGKISLPLIHDIRVEGRTPETARKEITSRLAEFLTDPEVTIIVEEIGGYRVYVLGEVTTQGQFTFDERPRLLQVLAAAGGFTEYAKKTITILRQDGRGLRRIEVDYKKLLEGDTKAGNLPLEPEDTLLAP